MSSVSFDDARWKATPKPVVPLNVSAEQLIMVNNDRSNWWHAPDRDEHDGVVYGFEVDISQGLEISVEINMDAKHLIAPHVWVKAGLELDGEDLVSGAVVTNPYSDWSIKLHSGGFKKITIQLKDRTLKVFEDEEKKMIRQNIVFGEGKGKATVGIMGASPRGEGARCIYRNFTLKTGL